MSTPVQAGVRTVNATGTAVSTLERIQALGQRLGLGRHPRVLDVPVAPMGGLDAHHVVAWQHCWPLVADPAPGIVAAIPLVCSMAPRDLLELSIHSGDYNRSRNRRMLAIRDIRAVVYWLGWCHGHGFMVASNTWRPGDGPAVAPLRGWAAGRGWLARKPKELSVGSRKSLAARPPIPAPHNVHYSRVDHLLDANTAAFMSYIAPPGQGGELAEYIISSDYIARLVKKCADNYWNPGQDLHGLCQDLDRVAGLDSRSGQPPMVVARNRHQFAHSCTLLASRAHESGPLLDAIDAGQPALPVIADLIGCSQRVLKAALSVHDEDGTTHELVRSVLGLRTGIALLEAANPQVLRRLGNSGRREWNFISQMTTRLREPRAADRGVPVGLYTASAWRLGGPLVHQAATTALARSMGASIPAGERFWAGLADCLYKWRLYDMMLMDFQRELISPAQLNAGWTSPGHSAPDPGDTARAILLAMPLARLLHVLDLYEDNCARSPVAGQIATTVAHWRVPSAEVVTPDGLHMRFLANQSELDHEAEYMHNCIAGYGERCSQGECAILSLGHWRQGNEGAVWKPSSSAMIVRGHAGLACKQHYSVGNDEPDSADKSAVKWWLRRVARRELEVDDNLPLLPGTIMADDLVADVPYWLGLHWNSRTSNAHRWQKWSRILDTRAPDFGTWLRTQPLPPGMPTGRRELLQAQVDALDAAGTGLDFDILQENRARLDNNCNREVHG